MTTETEAYVGIDVGKAWLDMAVWGQDSVKRVANDVAGIQELLEELDRQKLKIVAVEATGGYERLVVEELGKNGVPVAIVNPTRVRALAKATGKLAKTDKIDAGLIAEFAWKGEAKETKARTEEEICLRALITRREQLIDMRTVERNRYRTAPQGMRTSIKQHLNWLTATIKELETEISAMIKAAPEWQAFVARLCTIKGVGLVTAATVLVEMPELGNLNRQKIAALAGLAPYDSESGKRRGRKRIFGGRKSVRRVLYMACLSAIKYNPIIKAFYERLIKKGKVFKVAITACMRKMLCIMNAMTKNKTDWRLSAYSTPAFSLDN